MEDMAQISKDISHTGSFFAETFVSFIYLTAFLGGGDKEWKVSILIFILREKISDKKTVIYHASYSSFIYSVNKYLFSPYCVLDTIPPQIFLSPQLTEIELCNSGSFLGNFIKKENFL